jgi:hypothetical protein
MEVRGNFYSPTDFSLMSNSFAVTIFVYEYAMLLGCNTRMRDKYTPSSEPLSFSASEDKFLWLLMIPSASCCRILSVRNVYEDDEARCERLYI